MKHLDKAPKYIINEIINGNLVEASRKGRVDYSTSKSVMYTFRLFGSEKDTIEKLILRAIRIKDWFNKQLAGSAEVGDTGRIWRTVSDYVIEEKFVVIAIVDPFNREIEDLIEELSANSVYHKRNTHHLIEYPLLKNVCPADIDYSKREAYWRSYISGRVWWTDRRDDGKPFPKEEYDKINMVLPKITDSTYSLYQLKAWLETVRAEKISDHEYNMYFETENYYYWLRFNLVRGDNNIYTYAFRKEQ